MSKPFSSPPPDRPAGRLVLVVGPSGVGKDSLLDGARAALGDRGDVAFPRRVITRAPGLGGEDYIAVSELEFAALERQGRFALSWSAHGLHYGVPRAIDDDLRLGHMVVANVSRAVIAAARERYPGLLILRIAAAPETVRRRLQSRGRESDRDIEARLRRAAEVDVAGEDVVVCNNDGALADGIARFIGLLNLPEPALIR